MGGRLLFGFPDKMVTKLRYCDTISLSIVSGSLAKNVFRWNSTYDPDQTNVGHQPMYRDTYASIYDQYSVISAKAKVKVINYNTTTPIICGVVTDDDTTIASSSTVLSEQNHGMHTILPPLAGSLSTHTFNPTWDCKKVLGIDPFASETYKTLVGADPTEQSILTVWATNFDATTMSVLVNIELEQTVLWTELQTPSSS